MTEKSLFLLKNILPQAHYGNVTRRLVSFSLSSGFQVILYMNMNKGSATEEEILRFAQDDREPRMAGLEPSQSPGRMGLHWFMFICRNISR